MKVTLFNGSPRGEQSNTNLIGQAFLDGAEAAGAQTEQVYLIHKQIEYCRGCFSCWFQTPGQCVMKDDMNELMEKYMTSDVICFGTPVYTWNMTAVLKNFIDRLVPLRCPDAIMSGGSYDMKKRISKLPDSVVIANCGFPGGNNFETIQEVFKSCNPVLEIYRNSGQLLKSKNETIKIKVNEYLESVKQAGRELAEHGQVSGGTKLRLQEDLVSPDEYLKMMNL